MSKETRKISSERARQIAKLGKEASPWSQEAACCTPKAQASFKKGKRLHLIAAIANRLQAPKT